MYSRTDLGDLENFLPSWKSEHVGKKSYMADKVSIVPSLPRRDFSSSEGSPPGIPLSSLEKEDNIMTPDDLDCLRESCIILSAIQIRLPKAGETIGSARLGEVASYEAAFHAGQPTIKMILQLYNIYST